MQHTIFVSAIIWERKRKVSANGIRDVNISPLGTAPRRRECGESSTCLYIFTGSAECDSLFPVVIHVQKDRVVRGVEDSVGVLKHGVLQLRSVKAVAAVGRQLQRTRRKKGNALLSSAKNDGMIPTHPFLTCSKTSDVTCAGRSLGSTTLKRQKPTG